MDRELRALSGSPGFTSNELDLHKRVGRSSSPVTRLQSANMTDPDPSRADPEDPPTDPPVDSVNGPTPHEQQLLNNFNALLQVYGRFPSLAAQVRPQLQTLLQWPSGGQFSSGFHPVCSTRPPTYNRKNLLHLWNNSRPKHHRISLTTCRT